jgi:hypothetical protein
VLFNSSTTIRQNPEEISELAKLVQNKLIKEGRHHFIGESNPVYKQIKNGNHAFSNSDVQRANSIKSNAKQLAAGTHPNQQYWTCPYCNKSSKGSGNYYRWHGNKCKLNPAVLKQT